MRQFFAISFVLLFVLRPIIQFGQIGYYQFNIDEIIEKYCVNKERPELECNGKCFLNEQLEQPSNSSEEKPGRIFNLSETFLPAFYQESFNYNFEVPEPETKFQNWKTIRFINYLFESGIDRPPSISA